MARSAEKKGEGGRDEAKEVDTGQEALEAGGRILDSDAFPGFGKAGITRLFQGE